MSVIEAGIGFNRSLTIAVAVATSAAFASASGAAVITSRQSNLNYGATYGAGGDAFTPTDSRFDDALLSTDSESLQFSDFRQGSLPGDPPRPWSAGVSAAIGHQYDITGSLPSFSRIRSSGQATLQAGTSGFGLATIAAVNPGNSLEFAFSLSENVPASLSGEINLTPDGQNLAAGVELRRFDGFTWVIVFSSLFLPGQEGAFNQNLELQSGSYRLTSWAGGTAFAGVTDTATNSWSCDLQIIPAPSAAVLLGFGGLLLAKRRR